MTDNPFAKLGFDKVPTILAPLAGVSDIPFRRVCQQRGAQLSYVEMLSATALIYNSKRTYEMLARSQDESVVGVQVTGKSGDEVGHAVEILDRQPFETIDLNMGCPVTKVTASGSGSAILKDPERVLKTVKTARQATAKPLSVKIRIGWDRRTVTALEVAEAAQAGGADWLVVHGRLRSDDYGDPVRLDLIRAIKSRLAIPVIGNGNIFSRQDAEHMQAMTGCDGVMVSRGALGNPWIFRSLRGGGQGGGHRRGLGRGDGDLGVDAVSLEEWLVCVEQHLRLQRYHFGDRARSAICMRKHLLWYLKGWPGGKKMRERICQTESLKGAHSLIERFAAKLDSEGVSQRMAISPETTAARFSFDPKFDMDRGLDRGVGHDLIDRPS